MNIEQYKNQLLPLCDSLKDFDPNLADSDYKTLDTMFDIVYKSGVLDITHFDKTLQDTLKLELFTTLTKYSGTLAFLVIQILGLYGKHIVVYLFHRSLCLLSVYLGVVAL